MKVLFVDFDGVLSWVNGSGGSVSPAALAQLHRIVAATDCRIVVSSTWRHVYSFAQLNDFLELEILDVTPTRGARGADIQAWLDRHPVDAYAIVDDDTDMLDSQLPFFAPVKCDWSGNWPTSAANTGLDDRVANRIIAILEGS